MFWTWLWWSNTRHLALLRPEKMLWMDANIQLKPHIHTLPLEDLNHFRRYLPGCLWKIFIVVLIIIICTILYIEVYSHYMSEWYIHKLYWPSVYSLTFTIILYITELPSRLVTYSFLHFKQLHPCQSSASTYHPTLSVHPPQLYPPS